MNKIYGFFIVTLLFLAGCGGGGGGGGETTSTQPTIAKVVLATQGNLTTGDMSGIGVTLQLPVGVTPALAANGAVDSSAVKASGVLSTDSTMPVQTYYTPASGSSPGTLDFVLAKKPPNGFGIGEFATVTLNIAAGSVNFANVNLNSSAGITSLLSTGVKVISYSPIDLAFFAPVDKNNVTVTFTAGVI